MRISKKTKSIISGIVLVTIILGICGFAVSIFGKDTKTISSSAFKVGGLDENGKFKTSNTSIYTEDAFGCIGLRIVPDFEFKGTYDVYYYDNTDKLVDSKLGLTSTYDEDYPLYIAVNARIVIYPDVPDGTKAKDFKISFWEVGTYANYLTITVDKDQSYLYEDSINLYDEKAVIFNKNFKPYAEATPGAFDSKNLTTVESDVHPVKVTSAISVDGTYNKYDIYVYLEVDEQRWPIVALFDSNGKVVNDGNSFVWDVVNARTVEKPCWVKLSIEVPDLKNYEGIHLMVSMPDDSECFIFGYND